MKKRSNYQIFWFSGLVCSLTFTVYLVVNYANFWTNTCCILVCPSWIATMVLFNVIGDALRCRSCKYAFHSKNIHHNPSRVSSTSLWLFIGFFFILLTLEAIIWSIKLIMIPFHHSSAYFFLLVSGDCKLSKGS